MRRVRLRYFFFSRICQSRLKLFFWNKLCQLPLLRLSHLLVLENNVITLMRPVSVFMPLFHFSISPDPIHNGITLIGVPLNTENLALCAHTFCVSHGDCSFSHLSLRGFSQFYSVTFSTRCATLFL